MEDFAFKMINWDAYYAVEERIEQLEDGLEKERQYQLLSAVEAAINDVQIYMLDYEYTQHWKSLERRGISFAAANRRGVMLKWSKLFAFSISKQEKRRVHYEEFKWHLFSFELLDALKGDAARRAFHSCPKDSVLLFFQHDEDAYAIQNASLLRAEDLDFYHHFPKADLYIFDTKHKWTYIHTHEESCGPYFYQII